MFDVDLGKAYLHATMREFGSCGDFHSVDIGRARCDEFGNFDLAMAIGLPRPPDVCEVRTMLAVAHGALASGRWFITIDPCLDSRQSNWARFAISRNRGRRVRDIDGYARLAGNVFPHVNANVRFDMLHIPYPHAILECRG